MLRRLTLLILLLSLTAISGCVTVKVDAAKVFLPQEQHFVSVATGLEISGEKALKAQGITVEHAALPSTIGDIAVTTLRREGDLSRPLFVMCMGTSGERYRHSLNYWRRVEKFGDMMVFDYPGYDDSRAETSVKNFAHTAQAIVSHLAEKSSYASAPTYVWGHSLGGFICSEIARQSDVIDGVVIETSAQNVDVAVAARIPKLLKPFIRPNIDTALQGYDIADSLTAFDGPILVMGAGKDRVLGVKASRDLAEALRAQGLNVSYAEFEAVGHNTIPRADNYQAVMAKFITRQKSLQKSLQGEDANLVR